MGASVNSRVGATMSVMAAQYFQGGTFGPGASFDDGNTFDGVTFIAPVTFGAGNIFIGVTFECLRNCKRGPCGCCNDISEVGPGAVVVGSSGDHVKFDPTGVTENFVDTGCTLLTLPDHNDTPGKVLPENAGPISTTGTEVVVSTLGILTYEDWCKKCGMAGVLWDAGNAEVAP